MGSVRRSSKMSGYHSEVLYALPLIAILAAVTAVLVRASVARRGMFVAMFTLPVIVAFCRFLSSVGSHPEDPAPYGAMLVIALLMTALSKPTLCWMITVFVGYGVGRMLRIRAAREASGLL
jgi:hypothetical protein